MNDNIIYMTQEQYDKYLRKMGNIQNKMVKLFNSTSDSENYTTASEYKRLSDIYNSMQQNLYNIEIASFEEVEEDVVEIEDIVKIILVGEIEEEITCKLLANAGMNNIDGIEEISIHSPLGKAIYHKTLNHVGEYSVGNLNFKFKIVDLIKSKENKLTLNK